MDRGEVIKSAQNRVEIARLVQGVISSKGWNIFKELLDKKLSHLKNINSCKDGFELEVNKKTVDSIEEVLNEFEALVDTGDASSVLEKLEE